MSPEREHRGHGLGGGPRIRQRARLAAELRRHLGGERPDRDEDVHPGAARVGADLAVQGDALRSQLEHVAEHGDAPPACGLVPHGGAQAASSSIAARIDIGLAL